MRVDSIVSELAKTSRGKAEDIINEGRVFVNYENIMKTTKQIKENDIIVEINGKEILNNYEAVELIQNSETENIKLKIKRNEKRRYSCT